MPPEARIALFEDQIFREVTLNLTKAGHRVVATATNINQAEELCQRITDREVEADVAVVDGNLSRFSRGGKDGLKITQILSNTGVAIAIIGFSSGNSWDGLHGFISKYDPPKSLPEYITNL